MNPVRRALCGAAAVRDALARRTPLAALLAAREPDDPAVEALARDAAEHGVPVHRSGERELWRLAPNGVSTDVLAVAGAPVAAALPEVAHRPGPLWLLDGVRYPGNVGFALRTAEVAGAAGVVVGGALDREGRKAALRVSMGVDRFMPVFWEDGGDEAVAAARAAGRRVIGVEDTGERAPWEVDLRVPVLLVVGGERDGVPAARLEDCDEVVRVPMCGFVPAYNLQACVATLASEVLRQRG